MRTFFKNLFAIPKQISTPLGRWNIETCNKKLKLKVDMSNEDHCGPCGQYTNKNKDSKIHSTKKPLVNSRQFSGRDSNF